MSLTQSTTPSAYWKPESSRTAHISPKKEMTRSSWISWASVVTVLAMLVLTYGWMVRDRHYLTAENGLGYCLGIAGGVLMLMQLCYAMRKKLAFLRHWGKVKYWFQIHMLVGVIAPVLILYHANFGLGSTNSNVALASMLLVVFSGIIGRYIYSKIHLGLYGRRATLQDLHHILNQQQWDIQQIFKTEPGFVSDLRRVEGRFLGAQPPLLVQMLLAPLLPLRMMLVRCLLSHRSGRALRLLGRHENWGFFERRAKQGQVNRLIRNYLASLQGVVEFSIFTRLFSLWHVLHIPLFTMLVVSGVIHVIAVHMY